MSLMAPVEALKGKLAPGVQKAIKNSGIKVYIGRQMAWGQNVAGCMWRGYDGGNSAAQQQARTAFTAAIAQVATILADPTQRAQYEQQWKRQHKYKTLRGYIFAKVYGN